MNERFDMRITKNIIKALENIQSVMKGEAEKAGFNDPDDVTKYIKSLRKDAKEIYERLEIKNSEETLYLTSIPGMRDSIIEGMNEKIENCPTDLEW